MEDLDNLADFDETHAEIFYSNPFKIEDNFVYQYRITVVNDIRASKKNFYHGINLPL